MDARRYHDLRNRLAGDESLNRPLWAEHKWIVLEAIEKLGPLSIFDVQCILDLTADGVPRMVLSEMYEEGFLERIGTVGKRRYSLTKHGRERLAELRKK